MHASLPEAQTKHITLARLIPDNTPVPRLRVLQARYGSDTDPVAGATPEDYRRALLARITHLLANSPAMEAVK